ncbi:MAG: D-alanine--D-alanine ligase [Haliscomenobacter sp.]|nr:D-alanine--D-alanine ligase [Haliscomenobacter sp.]MBK7476701.1 D-alanine--D-alanine ligase [Haliscomenobacter sp.]MBK8880179.1 D-alanine--D-alanine ligase [Haliscomenobacter sp.]
MATLKRTLAVITGGNVAEREISLKSAETVAQHLDPSKYEVFILDLIGKIFIDKQSGARVDLNDFSLDLGDRKVTFDAVYLMLHGHPAEDGRLQGYFELLGIPYTGCDPLVSALTFDKQACKDFLKSRGIPMAPSVVVRKGMPYDQNALLKMGLPLFVKPNKNGSSFGVSKVNQPNELPQAIEKAFAFDNEVVVEAFLKGSEYSNGVLRKDGGIVVLPITEIIPKNEFFDFKAKYENESKEITPALLPMELTRNCQEQTRKIYEALGCRGIARFDYILVDRVFYFLEANTIPGMSEASIVPQQAAAHGWTITELLEAVVQEAL